MPKTKTAPFAVRFSQACRDDAIGRDKGYALCKSGEWESYLDNGSRMVTIRSIEARRQRLLHQGGKFKRAPLRGQSPQTATDQQTTAVPPLFTLRC